MVPKLTQTQTQKKSEHHVHLEGTLSPTLLFELAAKNSISLPPFSPPPTNTNTNTNTTPESQSESQSQKEQEQEPYDKAFTSPNHLQSRYIEKGFTSLDDFLHYYYIGFRVLITQSDYADLTYAYLSRAVRSANLRHAEVFFDPQMHLSRGVSVETVVAGFWEGVGRVRDEFFGGDGDESESGGGITALLIPCLLRDLDPRDGRGCFEGMLEGGWFSSSSFESSPEGEKTKKGGGSLGLGLAGIGLCGTEIGKDPSLWKEGVFDVAKTKGIRRTAHVGEEGPASYVMAAIEQLGVERVDHGIRAVEDEAVLDALVEKGIMLTVCPLSNVKLRAVEGGMAGVPIRKLLERGVKFSLNSDDPAYFGGYLQENYCAVQEAFGLSVGEWAVIARNAVEGSWCGEARKGEIRREVEEVLAKWENV